MFQLHKTWRNCNKFDSMMLLRAYYGYVKTPQCGYMEDGLKDIKYYVQKHIAPQAICHNPTLVCIKPLGAPTYCETHLLGTPIRHFSKE